ncbi:hypothetical protein NSQ89_14565 [Niallia sp. FSL R7-0648]|uniref:hypothetical protein n=1 Tax=Niallia sp. FSL R7-0648 TaxID=2954521 RepID=UPI0030F9E7CD
MNLILTGTETEVLTVHLHVMRKNIKTVLKRNYGHWEGKRLLKVYDKIKDELKDKLEFLEAEKEYHFVFNREELELLHSFLIVFFNKLNEEMKSKIKNNVDREKAKENMQLAQLEEVQKKVNELVGELVG